jgi:hypothetical protein
MAVGLCCRLSGVRYANCRLLLSNGAGSHHSLALHVPGLLGVSLVQTGYIQFQDVTRFVRLLAHNSPQGPVSFPGSADGRWEPSLMDDYTFLQICWFAFRTA